MKVNQTKKPAKAQWPKAAARAGGEDRLIEAIKSEVRKRMKPQGFIANLPDMHRWLSQDRWQDATPAPKDLLTPKREGGEELLDRLFALFAETGVWYGHKHKLPFDPHHPEADYPKALYQRHGVTQSKGASNV